MSKTYERVFSPIDSLGGHARRQRLTVSAISAITKIIIKEKKCQPQE